MIVNIIHGRRDERLPRLYNELQDQGITDFKIWEGIHDVRSIVRSINLSHKQIVKYAKDNFIPEICIGEDDVRFTHPNSFNYFLQNKPKEFDIYLSSIYLGEIAADNTVQSFSALHLYIVNERFYDTFLSLPEDEHLDRAMSGKGLFVVCHPFIAEQYDGFSSNTGKEEQYGGLMRGRQMYNG